MSNAELLAIVIKTGTKEETSVEIAQRILKLNQNMDVDNLNFLRELSLEQLMQIKGIGRVKAIQIKAICEFSIRMLKPSNYKKIVVKQPSDIANVVFEEMRFEKREKIKVVMLNSKNEILKINEIAHGGINYANASIESILSEPLKIQAPKIILIHNHPSGGIEPSKKDIDYTLDILKIAEKMGIQLMDHLVIGNMGYTSILSMIAKKLPKVENENKT